MCDCLGNIREALARDEKLIEPRLITAFMLSRDSGKTTEKAGKLEFTYYEKKQDGTRKARPIKSFLSYSHCPFCGAEY